MRKEQFKLRKSVNNVVKRQLEDYELKERVIRVENKISRIESEIGKLTGSFARLTLDEN